MTKGQTQNFQILIRSIEDPQQILKCYDYLEQEKGKASYCEENFIEEILDMKLFSKIQNIYVLLDPQKIFSVMLTRTLLELFFVKSMLELGMISFQIRMNSFQFGIDSFQCKT